MEGRLCFGPLVGWAGCGGGGSGTPCIWVFLREGWGEEVGVLGPQDGGMGREWERPTVLGLLNDGTEKDVRGTVS